MGFDTHMITGSRAFLLHLDPAQAPSPHQPDKPALCRGPGARAESGTGHGGKRPYGYEQGWMTLRETEAEVVRWMVERVIGGETLNGLVKQLNEQGTPTATGKQWHHTLVRQILTKPRIAGFRYHNGVTYQGAFPAIITVAEWELLQLAMARLRRAHFGGMQQGRKYLLTGLVYCGKCGQPMIGGAHRSFREEQSRPLSLREASWHRVDPVWQRLPSGGAS
jgi:hypothetical protein